MMLGALLPAALPVPHGKGEHDRKLLHCKFSQCTFSSLVCLRIHSCLTDSNALLIASLGGCFVSSPGPGTRNGTKGKCGR